MLFGDLIRASREDRGLTRRDVACNVGLHHSVLGDIERNTATPKAESVLKLIEYLDLDEADVLASIRESKSLDNYRSFLARYKTAKDAKNTEQYRQEILAWLNRPAQLSREERLIELCVELSYRNQQQVVELLQYDIDKVQI